MRCSVAIADYDASYEYDGKSVCSDWDEWADAVCDAAEEWDGRAADDVSTHGNGSESDESDAAGNAACAIWTANVY